MTLRRLLQHVLPMPLKLRARVVQRALRDWHSGTTSRIARPRNDAAAVTQDWPVRIILTQLTHTTPNAHNKIHNIRCASTRIEQVIVAPGRIFSFWAAIGEPNAARGYVTGRNLINGQLTTGYGGGLCQLAGCLYHAGLLAGLEIVERAHHSVDLYQEQNRFTPLGADAAVVYGYRDLRLRNPHAEPIRFVFEFSEDSMTCRMLSLAPIEPAVIEFAREAHADGVRVKTLATHASKTRLIADAVYRLPPAK